MTAPSVTTTFPYKDALGQGLYADNGAFVTDGSGNLTAAKVTAQSGLTVSGSVTGLSITAVSALTASTGISITAGGETITAGGLSITAGGETITAGGLSITAGGATVTGGLTADTIKGGTAAVQTLASSGAITIGAKVAKVTVSAGAAVTALSITTSGATGGQELHVINENAAGASTLIISSGVIVASGTTAVTISGLAAKKFIFDDTQTLWVAE